MKTISDYWRAAGRRARARGFALGLLALAAAACETVEPEMGADYSRREGMPVVFGAVPCAPDEVETRTAYSDFTVSGKERIDWVDGDRFRVYSPQAADSQGGHFCDYEVSGRAAEGYVSRAGAVNAVGGDPLLWSHDGTGHVFRAVYPAGGGGAAAAGGIAISETGIAAAIPATQTLTSGTDNCCVPDMSLAYMYATTREVSGGTDRSVALDFYPVFTALEFVVPMSDASGDSPTMSINSFTLSTSASGKPLAGSFAASHPANPNERLAKNDFSVTGGAAGSISVILPSMQITPAHPARFTVFALPVDLEALTVTIETSTSARPLHLDLKQNGEFVTFEGGKKYRITLPEVTGTQTYTIEQIPDIHVTAQLNTSTVVEHIKSYKLWYGGSTSYAPSGSMAGGEYTSSDAGVEGWSFTMQYSSDGTTWSDTPPAWLSVSRVADSKQGATERSMSFRLDATYTTPSYMTTEIVPEDIVWEGPFGSDAEPFDLSRHDVSGVEWPAGVAPVTANCYVLRGPGVYAFPLVYGNAIERGVSTLQNSSGHFKNYLGDPISSPYIMDDIAGLDPSGADVTTVWAEGDLAVGALDIVDASEMPGALLSCKYLKFSIPDAYPGNALIALKDGSGRIVWSWHLWVTPHPLGVVDFTPRAPGAVAPVVPDRPVRFLDRSLGCCDRGMMESMHYPARSIYIRLTQTDRRVWQPSAGAEQGLGTMTFRLIQDAADINSVYNVDAGTYYQWGRKDPFVSNITYASKHFTSPGGYYSPGVTPEYIITSQASLASSIQNPHTHYSDNGGGNGSWSAEAYYRDLWDYGMPSSGGGVERPVEKTVYDPCPPGFSLPSLYSFNALFQSTDGVITSTGADAAKPAWAEWKIDPRSAHYPFGGSLIRGSEVWLKPNGDSANKIQMVLGGFRRGYPGERFTVNEDDRALVFLGIRGNFYTAASNDSHRSYYLNSYGDCEENRSNETAFDPGSFGIVILNGAPFSREQNIRPVAETWLTQ